MIKQKVQIHTIAAAFFQISVQANIFDIFHIKYNHEKVNKCAGTNMQHYTSRQVVISFRLVRYTF